MLQTERTSTINEYELVTFFPGSWETPWRGRYLIEALSKLIPNSKILCVENPIDMVGSLIKHPSQFHSRMRTGNVIRRVRENLYVYRPWIFLNFHLAAKFVLFQKINLKWIKFQIDDVIMRNNFRTDSLITWFTDPFQADYLNVLDAKIKVFDCYDEYAAQSQSILFRTKKELIEKERRIMQCVHLSFVVSDSLYENKRIQCNAIHLVPNAVDIMHFGQAMKQSTLIPEDIRRIPSPIIGFLGNLSDRIDIDLLEWLAERNKEWSFVLIGGKGEYMKKRQLLAELAEKKNVYLFGNKPYEVLPGYLKAFDVCLIPFRENDLFSLSCSPLKLYEYLATGKPIVSTNLPGVASFNAFVRIAQDENDFEKHIGEALREKGKYREMRIGASEANSWRKRAEHVNDLLEDALNRRAD